jgi:hypothetical protein
MDVQPPVNILMDESVYEYDVTDLWKFLIWKGAALLLHQRVYLLYYYLFTCFFLRGFEESVFRHLLALVYSDP